MHALEHSVYRMYGGMVRVCRRIGPVNRHDCYEDHHLLIVCGARLTCALMLGCHNWQVNEDKRVYFSFAYSALAAMRMGTSGSASFQSLRKSW